MVSDIGISYSLKFGRWVYVHVGLATVAELSDGNDLAQIIDTGSMQSISNIAAISDQGAVGTFRTVGTNLQSAGSIPSGHKFILDFIVPLSV